MAGETTPSMRIAVVILHYGRPALAGRLHAQLTGGDPQYAEHVFVLDNCAPEPYPGAWRRTEHNLYWAGALDYALSEMAQQGYSHVWFLNNDLLFDGPPPYLRRAMGRLARMESILGPVGIYAPAVTANPYHPHMVAAAGMQYRTVEYVDGIAPLVSVACWQALGGVDFAGNPYGYGVDVWFSLCARRAGWQVVVDHGVPVRHRYHSTAREISGFMHTAARAEAAYLAARLGPDYRTVLAQSARRWHDADSL